MQSGGGYRIVKLVNGAYSVHSVAHRETFHPVIGPVAEAEALYVRQLKLLNRLRTHEGEFVIWDVGLGAAANVLAVLHKTRDSASSIRLVSFDCTLEPLQFAVKHSSALGYFDGYEGHVRALIRNCQVKFMNGAQRVNWQLHSGDFPHMLTMPAAHSLPKPHAIMFDAFSPAKNPAMWTQPLFANIYRLLEPNRACAMPTYSRATMLRVSLLLAGFFVGRGQATGEKEETTIAANRWELIDEPLDFSWLQRARNSTSAEPLWEPVYRQARLSAMSWEKLQRHPQFRSRRNGAAHP